jgi:drug/metabolite transporter (DMT)-like permease
MTDKSNEFRQRLLKVQEMSPELRQGYQKEIDALLSPSLTSRQKAVGIALLVLLLACVAGIVRAMLFYHPGRMILTAWVVLACAFSWAAYLIIRDLWRGTHSPKPVGSIAGTLTNAAGVLTVIVLMIGLGKPSDPKSMFDAFYVFVFYFACVAWGLESRITTAELASREQLLRMEYRLADIAERMGK